MATEAGNAYTPAWLKDPADPHWATDQGLQKYRDTLANCGKGVNPMPILRPAGLA
jgi:hypothetical protein